TGVHHYRKITYQDIYPRIDLEIKINSESYSVNLPIKYSFIVHPGGNPGNIILEYEGNDDVELNSSSVQIESALGKITESKPIFLLAGSGRNVSGSFIKSGNTIAFSKISYDGNQTLMIDPTI